jgi:arylsulfatase A-like enzyme
MKSTKPNILFIMSDDHAAHAISAYGSRINQTPNIDRIAQDGVRFDNCFCTNSICTPSRASILTGTYNHINGVTTLSTDMDNRLQTYPKLLQQNGYQTAIFGKWHLGEGAEHCPTGFDDWAVVPGQGLYHNPEFIFKGPDGGTRKTVKGYVTDIITDLSLEFLQNRDPNKPFCLMTHHKAPHRPWEPDEKHAHLYLNEDIPEPETLLDDYQNRSSAAAAAKMRVGVNMLPIDLKCTLSKDLSETEMRRWAYQRYIKDYLRVVASIDDNVGRILDYLDESGLAENTIVIYTSDQGFFLGDHGWYDKRFIYEESLRMPFLVRYPQAAKAGTINKDIVSNIDFAPLFLDAAGIDVPQDMQGKSLMPLLKGETPDDWRQTFYYRYWMHGDGSHNVYAHYGIRTHRYKLIYFYNDGLNQPGAVGETHEPEWELFDLENDPHELNNVYNAPEYESIRQELKDELHRVQAELGDERYVKDVD